MCSLYSCIACIHEAFILSMLESMLLDPEDCILLSLLLLLKKLLNTNIKNLCTKVCIILCSMYNILKY